MQIYISIKMLFLDLHSQKNLPESDLTRIPGP